VQLPVKSNGHRVSHGRPQHDGRSDLPLDDLLLLLRQPQES
jgi:hypothetical protein